MTVLPAPAPAIGHNKPPTELEMLQCNIELRHIQIMQEADRHIALVARCPAHFESDLDANFVSDVIKKIQVCQKTLERARKEEKEPFLRQGKFVDSFFAELHARLAAAIDKANAPLNTYLRAKAESERQIRERESQAMQKEQEAALSAVRAAPPVEVKQAVEHLNTVTTVAAIAEKEAAAPVSTMARAEGRHSHAALQEVWSGAITNIDTLDLHALRHFISRNALQEAVDRFVKNGGRQLEGTKIMSALETRVK